MSKRFTDTDKWDRPWFRKLPAAYKLLWGYITDKCDLAGVWYVDFEMAAFVIGEEVDADKALGLFQKQIRVVDEARWLIVDFVPFQYGTLTETNNLHRSVASRLRSLNPAPPQPQNSPSGGAKEKEREKEREGSVSSSGDRGAGKGGAVDVPTDLLANLPEITDWLEYKKQRGENYKPKGLEALWRVFREIPPGKRRESVDHSMSNNYAGLFQKTGGRNGNHQTAGYAEPTPGKYAD